MRTVEMKAALLAVAFLTIVPRLVCAQELQEEAVTAADLADKLHIYIHKFAVKFAEPVFAIVILREGTAMSSFETTRPAREFAVSFEAIPSEVVVEKPKQISFHANVTGRDGEMGTFASTNRTVVMDPRFFKEGFSLSNQFLLKFPSRAESESVHAQLPLDEEICLFEYRMDGKIDKTPAPIRVQGCLVFSKTQRNKN
jgi:hypothetical protein